MGKKNGLITELLENGMTLQTNYKNGLKNGLETYYYANGQKASEGIYKNSKLEGSLTYWYDNGNKKLVENYSNNQLDGSLIQWDKDGRKYLKQKYSNGDLREEKKYSYNGLGQIESTTEFIYNSND